MEKQETETAEYLQVWREDPTTATLARKSVRDRDDMVIQLLVGALRSDDANVRELAVRLDAQDELVRLLGGKSVRE